MGLEERNGHAYYYRKERDGDTVRSIYAGSGRLAQLEAELDRLETEGRKHERQRTEELFRAEQARLTSADAVIDDAYPVRHLLELAYQENGYVRRPNRVWRRSNG